MILLKVWNRFKQFYQAVYRGNDPDEVNAYLQSARLEAFKDPYQPLNFWDLELEEIDYEDDYDDDEEPPAYGTIRY